MELLNPLYWMSRGAHAVWIGTLATMDFVKFVLVPLILAYGAILLFSGPAIG